MMDDKAVDMTIGFYSCLGFAVAVIGVFGASWSVADVAPPTSAEEKATWTVVERCAEPETVGPGRGVFEVRYQTRGGDALAIEVRGCGKNRAYRKLLSWGGDVTVLRAYGAPFFKSGQPDLLLEIGLDDYSDFVLLDASRDFAPVVNIMTNGHLYFGDTDRDGRWEILILDPENVTCANGTKWGEDAIAASRIELAADTICKATN